MAEASENRLDVVSAAGEESAGDESERPWIGIHFECCGVYARVYRRAEEQHYLGRCPTCGRALRILVRADGVKAKVFRARPG